MRNFTLEVLPKFPARVDEGPGISIVKANGVYTFGVTGDNLAVQGDVADPANTEILVFLPDGTPALVPISVALAAVQPVQQTGKRNALINGSMAINQRAGLYPASTTRILTLDRWGARTGAGTMTSVTQSGSGAIGIFPRSQFQMITVGNTGVTTVDIDQRIEQKNTMGLRGPVTFSATIQNNTGSAFTPSLLVETPTAVDNWTASNVINGGGAGDALQSCPAGVNTQVTWSADISGYNNLINGVAFRLRFPSGSHDSNAKGIRLAQVQVEPVAAVGDPPSLFEIVTFGDELAQCQRYFYKTFPYGTVPAQNAGNVSAHWFLQGLGASASQFFAGAVFPVVMRANPTLTTYNTAAANIHPRNAITGTDWSATVVNSQGDRGQVFSATSPAGSAAGQISSVHLTADAEL